MNRFTFDNPASRVVFGAGSSARIADEVRLLNRSRVLVVGSRRALESLASPIPAEITVAVFSDAAQHLPSDVAERAIKTAIDRTADCIVAVGGGSAIGVAKAVALELALPIVAVPTTYGGSEMTSIWGISRNGAKETGRDPRVRPAVVIYDPDQTRDLSPATTACSGLNALAHCVEALYAADANPMSSNAAMQGLLLLTDALPRLASSPRDSVSRSNALEGAWLAGFALATVSMGIQHKLAHTLGGSFGLPHAETHAVLLPYTMAFNRASTIGTMTGIADLLEAPDAPSAFLDLSGQIGAPLSLREIGFRETDIDVAARLAAEKQYPNPRAVTEDGVRELLASAFSGDSHYVAPDG